MICELRIREPEYGGDEPELCECGSEVREHVVADSEDGEAGDGEGGEGRGEDQEEDLRDVVVALEVVQVGVLPQHAGYEGAECGLVGEGLGGGLVGGVVDEGAVDVEGDLGFVLVGWEGEPGLAGLLVEGAVRAADSKQKWP